MSYQSEAALEQQFIEQLNKQGYNPVSIPDYDALLENFKIQFAAFNAAKLDHPLTDKEWERVFNIMLGKSVFQSAKILRDIKEELGRTDNPQLLRKVEILQAFLDRVVVGLESADEIDAAYNDFENEAKREEIVAFAHTEEIDPTMLTDFISEYEFSGTMDAGNIRDRIEKPMPLLKKRSLVNRIVDFIRQHTEKFQ